MATPLLIQKPKGLGQRHVLAITGFFGFVISYSLRFSLSIAIVAMVNHGNSSISQTKSNQSLLINPNPDYVCPHPDAIQQILLSNLTSLDELEIASNPTRNFNTSSQIHLSNLTYPIVQLQLQRDVNNVINSLNSTNFSPITTAPTEKIDDLDEEPPGEFNWSESEQGKLHGSFFWGYIFTQLPGGWLGYRFGGKHPIGIGILITGLLAIITPFAAHNGGLLCLIFVRVAQGFGQGVFMPAMNAILAKWLPPDERGQIAAFVYSGMPCGTALSTLANGYIIHYLGWHSVFYISGLATIVWVAFWSYLVYSSPDEHPRISQDELKYIQNSIAGTSKSQVRDLRQIPWKKVCTSGPFWAILLCLTSETWGLFTIMTELPTYMKTVLHFDIKQNSLMSAFPHLLTWVVSMILTPLGDYAISKRYLSVGIVRKSCNTIGIWGFAAALFGVAYSGCDRTITVTLLALAMAARGGVYGGVLTNSIDIAPNYAGVLMGIANTVAGCTGVVAPWVAGTIIDDNPSIQQWRLVFLIAAGIGFVGNLLFLIFASGEEQSWNQSGDNDDHGTDPSDKTVEIPSLVDGEFRQFYSINGPLAATLPMTMIITTTAVTNEDEERDINDFGVVTNVTMTRNPI